MPRDFDEVRREREQRDRSFLLGGETFTYRAGVAPEVIADWDESGETKLSQREILTKCDEVVLAMLEPGQEEAWRAVRDIEALHPLNLDDLMGLVKWLVEQQTGRPTQQPSGSSTGPDGSGTSTTGESPSPAEVASQNGDVEAPAAPAPLAAAPPPPPEEPATATAGTQAAAATAPEETVAPV